MKNRVNVIVPVYADEESLKKCLSSLLKYYTNKDWLDVYIVNDNGPEADTLEALSKSLIKNASNFYYHRNPENLGFIRNVNNATFSVVKDKRADILLLNSDTELKTGAVERMNALLLSNKKIGAVNPKTNGATMFGGDYGRVSISVPLNNSLWAQPAKSYKLFKKQIKETPEYSELPVFSGFCVLIRRSIIDKIGFLDEAYGKGYFDDNDMSMRVKEAGYKIVVSNRAFVAHFGSKSFSDIYRVHRSNINQRIFLDRYPNYSEYIIQYPEALYDPAHKKITIARKAAVLLAKILNYGNEHGYRSGLKKALKKGKNKVRQKFIKAKKTRQPMVQVWFHSVTPTGAPLVLVDLIREWKRSESFPKNIDYFYPVHSIVNDQAMLNFSEEGIDPKPVSNADLNFERGDIVILNSALPDWLYSAVIAHLKEGIIKHAYLYIHENNDLYLVKHIDTILKANKDLIEDGKITIYTPSKAAKTGWTKSVGTSENIFVMAGRTKFDSRMFTHKSAEDFNKINFASSGSNVPRKGYLGVVYAFVCFYNEFYKKDKSKYRDFSLNILGFSRDDYFYSEFLENAAKGLGNKIKLLPESASMSTVYDFYAKNNLNITYSIHETYSMATIEGMAFGHPIIRSEVPGLEEQLKEGKNGWLAPTTDWWKLVEAIEEVLNKEKTSNETLRRMSEESITIAQKAYSTPYRFIKDFGDHKEG